MLDALFNPGSVAIIGASADPGKVGHAVLLNLKEAGFSGPIYPVNPKSREILGLKAFPSVREIPGEVDLAVIVIPAAHVPDAMREAAGKGVKTAVVISAGFKEAGAAGILLEEEIRSVSRQTGIRILGPNCLGVVNTACGLNATFAAGMLPPGRLAFFSQSGALGIAILDWAIGNRMGFSKFISLGNKADLNETDFLEYFLEDPDTDVILGYIEDVVNGRRFLESARKATKCKPVILMKAGGTGAGARAASSHTGALAGSENAFRAAFRQTGVIRAEGVEDLFEAGLVFGSGRLPAGNRLLIVTNAGGPGIIAADTAEKEGISLPQLDRETMNRLRKALPGNASLYNPIDIIGDANAGRYAAVLDQALVDPNVDGILVMLTPQAMINAEDAAKAVIDAAGRTSRPFISCFMGEERVRTASEMLRSARIPNFSYPEPAVRSFRRLVDHASWVRRKPDDPPPFSGDRESAGRIIEAAASGDRPQCTEDEVQGILSSYGFRFPRKHLAVTPEDASRAAAEIGFPVVMKVSSPDILHKTDIGGVKLGISSPEEAAEAFAEITRNARRFMPRAFLAGVSVFETVPKGREVILGVSVDRTFGPLLMFGLGGIYVEVLKDVSFRIVPVGPSEARAMVEEVRSFPLLRGVRGERPADLDAIVESILRLSSLATDLPEVLELDINPLVVLEHGAIALDARIIIRHKGAA